MTTAQMHRLRKTCPRWDSIVTEAEVGCEWARFGDTDAPVVVVRVDGLAMPVKEVER